MSKSRRVERVSSLLKKEIGMILMNDLNDDLITQNFVSITKIELSSDLQFCKVYISSSAQYKMQKEIIDNLNSLKGLIRHSLSKRVVMRRIPEITFRKDKVMDQELTVLKVLDELKKNSSKSCIKDNSVD